ncbi:MAG: peptidoglycan D,D-transpeptidase FtsI family protein [Elsteraceae bacterium]
MTGEPPLRPPEPGNQDPVNWVGDSGAGPSQPRRRWMVWLGLSNGRADPVETAHNRLVLGAGLFACGFIAIGLRLLDVTLINTPEPRLTAARKTIPVDRGAIIDRNGVLLATSLPTISAYADPRKVPNPVEAAKRIAQVLPDVKEDVLRARLTGDRTFVFIKRNLTPRQQVEINRLGIPGVGFQREDKRVYPQGPLVSHVLGFSDIDNQGISGVEKHFNEALRGGETIQLSLDLRVQSILRQELQEAQAKFQAIGAAGMVMDARTGEILGMVSLPDFDPNEPGAAPEVSRFNRNTLGVYEMGSTFKLLNTAMALENGTATLTSSYDASKPIQFGRFTINDYKGKNRWLSVPEIVMYSSNLGSARMALEAGMATQRAFLDRMRMLSPPKLELPEVGKPMVPQPWRQINTITIAFGHGIAVTPVQTVGAIGALVNGGVYLPPTLMLRNQTEAAVGDRVISPKTSDSLRRLMRLVVEQGSGKAAATPGYVVGGKTGTAEKSGRGGYKEKSLFTSFLSAFPMHDPRYVVLVMMDEPKATKETFGYATAGYTAAPSVGKIIGRLGPLFGIPPVDESSPEIRRLIAIDVPHGSPNTNRTAVAAGGPRATQ